MPAPYSIHLDPKFGTYNFDTDQGLIYSCKFSRINQYLSPLLGVYDIDVNEFMFFPYDPEPEIKKTYDPRIAETLENLVVGYFTTPDRVLAYLCDMSDGRQQKRSRLFEQWAANRKDIRHHSVKATLPSMTVYGGVMNRRDFPYPDLLQVELINKAPGIMLDKF